MFNLEDLNGYKIYVEFGITLAGNNYSIYRLKGLGDKIIKRYEDMLTLDKDDNSRGTVAFYAAWKDVSIKYLGKATSITEPHLFVHFVHGRKAADKEGAKYHDWVAAQFERWPNSMPELGSLYGDNASLGYTKYIGLKDKEYETKDEKQYFEDRKIKVKAAKRKKSSN